MKRRLFVWWYATIALGFTLLAVRSVLVGDHSWLTGLRLMIAAGFVLLAWFQHRGR